MEIVSLQSSDSTCVAFIIFLTEPLMNDYHFIVTVTSSTYSLRSSSLGCSMASFCSRSSYRWSDPRERSGHPTMQIDWPPRHHPLHPPWSGAEPLCKANGRDGGGAGRQTIMDPSHPCMTVAPRIVGTEGNILKYIHPRWWYRQCAMNHINKRYVEKLRYILRSSWTESWGILNTKLMIGLE